MSYNGFCPWCTAGGFTKEELKHHLLHECEDFRLGDSVSSGEDLDWYELFREEIAQCNALRATLARVTSERDGKDQIIARLRQEVDDAYAAIKAVCRGMEINPTTESDCLRKTIQAVCRSAAEAALKGDS